MHVHRRTADVDGRTRRFIVIEPEDLGPQPDLLLFFHGSQQSANVLRRFTNGTVDALANATNTLIVYPDGIHHHFNDTRAELPVRARELGVDDVAFSAFLIETMQREYTTARTFAAGYSNGGQMVLRLLFDAPFTLTRACIIASTLGEGSNHAPTHPDGYRPTPLLFIHGTEDPIAPYDGGLAGIDAHQTRGRVLSAPATAEYFALTNGCRPPRETRPIPEVTSTYYDGAYPVELWTMEGLGHVIPSGNETPPRIGPNTNSFNAVDKIRDFFGLVDATG
ncbi:hypothetical protein GWO69_08725 [Corynebacterium macginleyi]|uniref:alpha/beta hydrolase family esterase n=1 Tax=Corynebacterium macginleyi TaxID=38290 RepID=UPI00190ACC9F|nr:hypothetical protein [Corynebacterium macginleyi]MBK4157492.1 hypothetical protein [Corynebacterium macginleyi]MBK4161771.1 hypothetical protein [Corynebacterium macginleyi]MBK4179870.1 hypothetical protein [Corynebacterium macginleyi]MBK4182596.1 hypothetical protein [Corynebacterium macginleyi]